MFQSIKQSQYIMILAASLVFYIKHWLMKIRLMFSFLRHAFSFTLLCVSGKWDKEKNSSVHSKYGRKIFTSKGKGGTIFVCHLLTDSIFIRKNLLFVSCFWNVWKNMFFSHEKDIHFIFTIILSRDARKEKKITNANKQSDDFKFVFFFYQQLSILLKLQFKRSINFKIFSILKRAVWRLNEENVTFKWNLKSNVYHLICYKWGS